MNRQCLCKFASSSTGSSPYHQNEPVDVYEGTSTESAEDDSVFEGEMSPLYQNQEASPAVQEVMLQNKLKCK